MNDQVRRFGETPAGEMFKLLAAGDAPRNPQGDLLPDGFRWLLENMVRIFKNHPSEDELVESLDRLRTEYRHRIQLSKVPRTQVSLRKLWDASGVLETVR